MKAPASPTDNRDRDGERYREIKVIGRADIATQRSGDYMEGENEKNTSLDRLREVLLSHGDHDVLSEKRLGKEHPKDVVKEE